MFLVNLADCRHPHDHLDIFDQLLIATEEKVQTVIPQFLPLIIRGTGSDLRDQVLRIMRLHAGQSLLQVKCGIRCIQKVFILIQIRHVHTHHRLRRIGCCSDVFVIAPLKDKLPITVGSDQHEQERLRVLCDDLGNLLFSGQHNLFGNPCLDQCLLDRCDFFLRILDLQIQELFHCANRKLLILYPALAVIADISRGRTVLQFFPILPDKHLRLIHVGVIFWLQVSAKLFVILVRRHIIWLFHHNLVVKLLGTVPDGGQFPVRKRRVTFLGVFQKCFLRLIRIAVPFQHPDCEPAHGIVPAALQDRAGTAASASSACSFLFVYRLHLFIHGQPAFMPDALTDIRPIDEPRGIQSIPIKEIPSLVDTDLQRLVLIRIRDLPGLKVHMHPRSRSHTVLILHVVPAERYCIGKVSHHFIQLLRRDPVLRILGMVIINIHDHHVCPEEVLDAAVILLILTADMVHFDGFPQILRRRYFHPVGIKAVRFGTGYISRLQH